MEVSEIFDIVSDEYNNFELIENKRSLRPDLHALILLDELFPQAYEYDNMIYESINGCVLLNITQAQINTLTVSQIIELSRCGVTYDNNDNEAGLYLNV